VPDRFSHALASYEFNPDCGCEVCANGGVPARGPDSGHSYAYDEPHMPPCSARPLIGKGTFIHPTAYIAPGVRIGDGCRIGPGASIGWEGFGYSPDPDGGWQRKPETHSVVIGDRVHIGANACIDRGSYRDTRIGDGTKIDNLCHIAHNVQIGQDCLIIALSMIAGSVEIGDRSYVAPATAIRDHRVIGDNVFIGLGSVVVSDLESGATAFGVPARERECARPDIRG
jgi:UDP-3-O-[3-hydroxymyristoyl] glucosamine N-acyltransferase